MGCKTYQVSRIHIEISSCHHSQNCYLISAKQKTTQSSSFRSDASNFHVASAVPLCILTVLFSWMTPLISGALIAWAAIETFTITSGRDWRATHPSCPIRALNCETSVAVKLAIAFPWWAACSQCPRWHRSGRSRCYHSFAPGSFHRIWTSLAWPSGESPFPWSRLLIMIWAKGLLQHKTNHPRGWWGCREARRPQPNRKEYARSCSWSNHGLSRFWRASSTNP